MSKGFLIFKLRLSTIFTIFIRLRIKEKITMINKLFILAISIGLGISAFAQDLPEVIALREIEIHDETNEVVFKNYYTKWCDVLKDNSKGMSGWLMKGDRGERVDKYIFAYGFDYKAVRDYYFPTEPPAHYKQFYALPQEALSKLPPGVEGTNTYTDFIVLGYKDIIRPMMGELLGIHFINIKARKSNDFEKFVVEEFNPGMYNKIPGLNLFILKGDRGEMEGHYILMYNFETVELRDLYVPESGQATEEFKKEFDPVMHLWDKLQSYIEETSSWTDYVVVY